MSRPKTPIERTEYKRRQPSSTGRRREEKEEYERTIPGRRTPEPEKKTERIVNEDEQLKAVNNREDNAQSRHDTPRNEDELKSSNEDGNERLEASDDNAEVNPRLRKVN